MAGSLLPQPKQVAFDSAMNPGIAYQFYTYDVGTLTPKATYQDAALTIANTNPVIANGRGEVVMYGTGAYRLILKDALGSTIWDRDNVESPASAAAAFIASLAASAGSALVGFQQFSSSTVRTVQDKLRDYLSVKDFGAKGDGVTDDTAAIQAGLDAAGFGGTLHMPAGTYKVSATLTMKSNASLIGAGSNSTLIRRYGNYGHTLKIGDTTNRALAATVKGVWFMHGEAWGASDTTLTNPVSAGGAHIYVEGGQYINIEYCWFHRMPFGIIYNQSSWCRLSNNQFSGVWDLTRPALQEGVANVLLQGGNVSSVFENNEFLGAKLTRSTTITDGTGHSLVVPGFVDLVGPQYGLLIQGAEDFTCTQNFFGAHSQNSILFSNQTTGAGVIDVRITENMFDESRYGHVVFAPGAANLSCLGVTISDNIFNGESDSLNAIVVGNNTFSNTPSVYGLGIHNNRMFAYYGSMIVLAGAKGFEVSGNTITNYNCLGVSPDDLNFVAGVLVLGTSSAGEIHGNVIGGGGNVFTTDTGSNFCYAGVYVDAAVDAVTVRDNFYAGIRTGSTIRSGPARDERQVLSTVAGNYAMRSGESVYIARKTVSATHAITLPPLPMAGREVVVKDGNGDAVGNNIIIGTADGALIDGVASVNINTAYGFKRFRYNGAAWNVIG